MTTSSPAAVHGGDSAFSVRVDSITAAEWRQAAALFDDGTLYQTWTYGAVRWRPENLLHCIVREDGEIRGAVQFRRMAVPLTGPRMAYTSWGPLWRRRGGGHDSGTFRKVVRALREELVAKRKYCLRLKPCEVDDGSGRYRTILREEGYTFSEDAGAYRTLLVDLTPDLEELAGGLKKKWRWSLNRSRKNGLRIEEGSSTELYDTFRTLYRQMHARKGFHDAVDVDEFGRILKEADGSERPGILLCLHENEPVAALVWSAVGERGIPLLSATGNRGLELRGSYLLRWRLLEILKERGCRYLDQGGINIARNPGGYSFKSGMGGREAVHIGQYDAYPGPGVARLIGAVEKLRGLAQSRRSRPAAPAAGEGRSRR